MYRVSIVRGYDPKAMVLNSIANIGPIEKLFPNKDERILIKPNFGCHRNAMSGATTDLRVLKSLIEVLKDKGYKNVIVAEGAMTGYINIDVFNYLGVNKLCAKLDVPIININHEKGKTIRLTSTYTIKVPDIIFESKMINLAKLKTHVLTTVSLGIKNLLGCVIGYDKRLIHLAGLDKSLVKLAKIIVPTLTIIEGLIGMEGRGPVAGNPVKSEVMISSSNVLAADLVASMVMGMDPFLIPHLRIAVSENLGPHTLEEIEIVGCTIKESMVYFTAPHPKLLERNPLINKAKHWVRGLQSIRKLAYAMLSSRATSEIFGKIGIIQEVGYDVSVKNPKINKKLCKACGICVKVCPGNAIQIDEKATIDPEKCLLCGCCVEVCQFGAISCC